MKFKKALNNIGMLIIIITIIVFNLIIGGNEKILPILTMCIILAFSFSLLLIKKIKYKEKLIKSKIDITVSLFMAILFLPLLFKTYCSFEGSIEFILKYFFVYTIYLLIRNVVDTKNKYNILITTVILSSLIPIILGIDIQNAKHFEWLIEKLDLAYTEDYRFSSTFGYANAVSIYILFCIFLSINKIENLKKNSLKIFYFLYIILGSYIIYISYSRLVLILYVLSIIFYFGVKIYNKIKNNKKLLINIIHIICIVFGVIVIYLLITIKIPKPYVADKTFKLRKNLETNKEYNFIFDIDIISTAKDKSKAELVILEVNKYFNETEIGRIILNPNKNIFNAKIKTSEDVYYIKFKLINVFDKQVIINRSYINNKEYIFSYKYIPSVISRLITSFSLEDDSIVLRKQFYENCLRISKDSLFIGHGGNAWKRLSLAYEEYPYAVKETHSYFFELLISYGIIGLVAFLLILLLFCKAMLKELINNKESRKLKSSVFIGLMLILLYNLFFDFGMSFIVIILISFGFIALLQFGDTENINFKYIDAISLIVIGFVFIALLNSCIAKYFIKDSGTQAKLAPYVLKYNKEDMDKNNIEDIKNFIQKEPYRSQNDMYRLYWNALYENRNVYSEEQVQRYIDFGIETLETKKCVSPIYFQTIFERIENIKYAVIKLEEMKNTNDSIIRIKQQMRKEYNIYSNYIQDTNRNHRSKEEAENALNYYKSILKSLDIKLD